MAWEAEEALAQNDSGRYLGHRTHSPAPGAQGRSCGGDPYRFPRALPAAPSRCSWKFPAQAPKPVDLERGWPHKGRIILKFSGIDSIESASRLRGLQVFIPWEQRAPLPPHHYYLCELHGCRVIWEREGREIGTVIEVESTGGVDVLHVRRPDGKSEVLIPLAQEICTRIDLASQTIVIDPPEDLLDLNA